MCEHVSAGAHGCADVLPDALEGTARRMRVTRRAMQLDERDFARTIEAKRKPVAETRRRVEMAVTALVVTQQIALGKQPLEPRATQHRTLGPVGVPRQC